MMKFLEKIRKFLPPYETVRWYAMIICAARSTISIYRFMHHHSFAMANSKEEPVVLNSLGAWAVVTGASNGLGRAFCDVFAAEGINIVLIDYDKRKLDYVANTIVEKYEVLTIVITTDYKNTRKEYKRIHSLIFDLDIGILVNNIHENYPRPEYFTDLENPYEVIRKIINTNIFSYVYMTRLVLPDMVDKHKGLIINVSSFTVDMPAPMLTVFAAAKTFVTKFTEDLEMEMEEEGIKFLCLTPGLMDSKWLTLRRQSWMAPLPERYLKSALLHIGIHVRTNGYYVHTMMVGFVHFVMRFVTYRSGVRVVLWFMNKLREISIRGYLK